MGELLFFNERMKILFVRGYDTMHNAYWSYGLIF